MAEEFLKQRLQVLDNPRVCETKTDFRKGQLPRDGYAIMDHFDKFLLCNL
jgi:hypothetical protein